MCDLRIRSLGKNREIAGYLNTDMIDLKLKLFSRDCQCGAFKKWFRLHV